MRYAGLLVFALAMNCVAADVEDEEVSETEQAMWDGSGEAEGETILVQGGLDPCWAGRCWPSSWPTDPGPSNTGDGGHGGGGGIGRGDTGKADPHPIPAPRDCTAEATRELCLDCCDWNVENVWGERCRRLPEKDQRRRLCWEEAEARRADCHRMCPNPGPILTIEAQP